MTTVEYDNDNGCTYVLDDNNVRVQSINVASSGAAATTVAAVAVAGAIAAAYLAF